MIINILIMITIKESINLKFIISQDMHLMMIKILMMKKMIKF